MNANSEHDSNSDYNKNDEEYEENDEEQLQQYATKCNPIKNIEASVEKN